MKRLIPERNKIGNEIINIDYCGTTVGTARRELFDRVVVFGREHALALPLRMAPRTG